MSEPQSYPPIGPSARSPWRGPIVALTVVVVAGILSTTTLIRCRNELVALETGVQTQWQQIDSQLLRQSDLIPNLVEVTRAYAEHEREIFSEVSAARSRYAAAEGEVRAAEAAEMQSTLGRLIAVAEAYPELRADGRFRDLQIELAGTQNRIALERHRYNEIVGLYNARLRMFPWLFVSEGFEPKPFFEIPSETPRTVQVDL